VRRTAPPSAEIESQIDQLLAASDGGPAARVAAARLERRDETVRGASCAAATSRAAAEVHTEFR
jgi:hypothetical protein